MSNIEKNNQLFISLRSTLSRAVSRIVPPKEIEDIVQETYVRVCQVEKQDEIRHPRSFMLKTAKNLALDYIKRAETRLTISNDDEQFDLDLLESGHSEDGPYDHVVANQEFGIFCDAVRLLPQQCRKVFVLRKVYGYSQKEIAERLELSENTVEKHVAMGIKRCAQFMSSLNLRSDKGSTQTVTNFASAKERSGQ